MDARFLKRRSEKYRQKYRQIAKRPGLLRLSHVRPTVSRDFAVLARAYCSGNSDKGRRLARMRSHLIAAALFTLALAGCGGSLRLIADGRAHNGSFNKVTKSMQVTIDGRLYKGPYVLDAVRGVGSAFSSSGQFVTSSGTAMSSNARALLVSDDNQVLRCQFAAGMLEALGVCVDGTGKSYDMIAGG